MLKIMASADFHLGMKFAGYPDVRERLAEARFETLQRLIDRANDDECSLFLIAGDLFDRVSVSARDIIRCAEILNAFNGPLISVLPGNHDFYSGSSSTLWTRFSETAGDRILLLRKPQVYDLDHYDLNILLYAGPCDSKHGKNNAVSWLKAAKDKREPTEPHRLHIGVAHGSIEGISPDAQGVYFPMKRSQLENAPVDLWIIGHTHRQHPNENHGSIKTETASAGLLIPGTPEPDGFDCSHGGTAWLIEADEKGQIRFESMSTGTYGFHKEEYELEKAADLQRLLRRLQDPDGQRTLLRLKLSGRLSASQLSELRGHLEAAEQSLFYTHIDDSGLLEKIGEQTIEREFTQGSFPYRLLKSLIAKKDFEALQTAYALLKEQKR